MLIVWCWRVLLLVVLAWLGWMWLHRSRPQGRHTAVADQVQRLLLPRTADDCPACRQPATGRASNTALQPIVTPCSAVKSRRGAMGRINTHGFACPNHTCPYYRIRDAQVHALVGDGTHGRCERIQTLRCQACQTTFSTRRGYPLGDATLLPQNGVPTGLVKC